MSVIATVIKCPPFYYRHIMQRLRNLMTRRERMHLLRRYSSNTWNVYDIAGNKAYITFQCCNRRERERERAISECRAAHKLSCLSLLHK